MIVARDMCPYRYQRCSESSTAKRVSEEKESFQEVLLVRGSAMMVEPKHNHVLRVDTVDRNFDRAIQEGMLLELLQ